MVRSERTARRGCLGRFDPAHRSAIAHCSYPVISATPRSGAKVTSGVEWNLAVDRSHLIAEDQPFLVPVVADATPDMSARVPDSFRQRQWMRLDDRQLPAAAVDRLIGLLAGGSADPTARPRTHREPARPFDSSEAHGKRCGGSAPPRRLRAAVRQHERRSGAGVFQRRHQRGHHHRPLQGLGAVGRARATPPSPSRARTSTCRKVGAATERQPRAGRQRAQGRGPGADHRPADRRRRRRPRLGRALRPRPHRHLRAAGRDHARRSSRR